MGPYPVTTVAFLAMFVTSAMFTGCLALDERSAPVERLSDAEALVWGHPYSRLVVEVDYVEGRSPNKVALQNLMTQLGVVTDKDVIELLPPTLIPANVEDFSDAERNWTHQEAVDVARAVSDFDGEVGRDKTAVLHLVYLNGYSYTAAEGGYRISGFNRGNLVLIFPDDLHGGGGLAGIDGSIRQYVQNATIYEKMERWLVIHEVGHALGLIGLGAPITTPRQSERNPVHSTESSSPMYEFDTSGASYLDDVAADKSAPYEFNEHDLDDLAALRAAGREFQRTGRRTADA